MEQELKSIVDNNILSPVTSGKCGTPIAPLLISDRQIRICMDLKLSLNPYFELDTHPIPGIEDLVTVLQKGETFYNIDLSQAYQQITLGVESKSILPLSTRKGLFACNRICY